MPRKFFSLIICGLASLAILSARVWAAGEFSGQYKSDRLSIDLVPQGSAYVGEVHLGSQHFPLKAQADAGQLRGTFSSDGNDFEFSASLKGDTLTLVTGGATHVLRRAPVNPLARTGPANPLQKAAGTDALAGYAVVTSTDFGKALSAEKPSATSVLAAMQATFPDLARYFDAKPQVTGAYEDVKDHRSGGASFTARLHDQPVKGFVSCKLGERGAAVAVIYCREDAPPAEWTKLTAAPADAAAPPAAEVRLQEYRFPDGTGSIGVAPGWTTNAQTCLGGVTIKGPDDQAVNLGFCASVVTPDSTAVQMQRQLEMNARQMGFPPPPPMQLLVAPLTPPDQALTNLLPQISNMGQRLGKPAVRLDKILQQQKVNPMFPGGNAALLSYEVTKIFGNGSRQYRALAQMETDPMLQGSWLFWATELIGPQESFGRDLPVMLAMAKSLKTDDRVIQERTRQNIDAQNQRFAAQQQAHREQMDSFDRANRAWERRSLETSRSNADFDEVIRGYRTVEDTRTGEKTSVDLGNVDHIVDHLNEGDPGRYKQIPARDEYYPLPTGQGQ